MGRLRKFDSDEVIDRAICLFISKGYEATSVKDLVDAANVHPGSLYHQFGSKKQIFEHALNRYVSTSPFNQLLENAETADPQEALETLFTYTVSKATARAEKRGCLVTNTAMELGGVDTELSKWVSESLKKTEDQICRLIERGQENGQFSATGSARKLAQFILSATQGMQVLAKVNPDPAILQNIAHTALCSLKSNSDSALNSAANSNEERGSSISVMPV